METAYQAFEESTFLNVDMRETNATANYTVDTATNEDQVVRLRGNDTNRQLGPGKLMQVMTGDTVAMEVFAYHTGGYTDNGSVNNSAILAALISSVTGAAPAGTETANVSVAVNNNAGAIFVGGDGNSSNPRAYINYILFDQDFEFLDAGFNQVSNTASTHQQLILTKPIDEAGFIYVYLSNESNTSHDVYFDDLRITHTKSRILQENHYYPFGATVSALSSSAPLSEPNRFLYNEGSEKVFDLDLGVYETPLRILDPVLGRWWQVDPAASVMMYQSPYLSMDNNPILLNDPFGDCPTCPQDPEEADKIYEVGAVVENKNGKWEYLGDGKWKDLTVKVGSKVLPRRNGWDAWSDIIFGTRDFSDPGGGTYEVNYKGEIIGIKPEVAVVPDIIFTPSPGGKVSKIRRAGKLLANPSLKRILPSWKRIKIDIDHIADSHIRGGANLQVGNKKTLFPQYLNKSQVASEVRSAYRNVSKKLKTRGDNILVRGTSDNGITMEMWINKSTKTIETAYPIDF